MRRWLLTPDPDEQDEDNDSDDHFQRWLLKRMAVDGLLDVGGVLVDRALIEARYACVPELCSPAVERGHYRSCCADLTVDLTWTEATRLSRHRQALAEHLARYEPRLARRLRRRNGKLPRFFLDQGELTFCRPGKRCVFSEIDARGRIRCHLHAVHKQLGIDRTDLQPITCRLFPLVLCYLRGGRLALTLVNRDNYRAWSCKHPKHFPCLSAPGLPPALRSLQPTLDWMFGAGFTRAVRRAARASTPR